MRIRYMLALPVLAAFAALVAPAVAETLNRLQTAPGHGMGRIGHGMMSRGTMGGGCAEMMQSMNGGTERPNSQWRSADHSGRSMPN
jgi:hypothetical protein